MLYRKNLLIKHSVKEVFEKNKKLWRKLNIIDNDDFLSIMVYFPGIS